jgi:hypothetical protein
MRFFRSFLIAVLDREYWKKHADGFLIAEKIYFLRYKKKTREF